MRIFQEVVEEDDELAHDGGEREFRTLGDRVSVHDRYEIMAFAAEARTKAVGATPDQLTLNQAVNLQGVAADGQKIWPIDDQSVKLHDSLILRTWVCFPSGASAVKHEAAWCHEAPA